MAMRLPSRFSTVTFIAQVSGQSCGQAALTVEVDIGMDDPRAVDLHAQRRSRGMPQPLDFDLIRTGPAAGSDERPKADKERPSPADQRGFTLVSRRACDSGFRSLAHRTRTAPAPRLAPQLVGLAGVRDQLALPSSCDCPSLVARIQNRAVYRTSGSKRSASSQREGRREKRSRSLCRAMGILILPTT